METYQIPPNVFNQKDTNEQCEQPQLQSHKEEKVEVTFQMEQTEALSFNFQGHFNKCSVLEL